MNAILTISGFLFPLITFPYVSRILLPVGIGKVTLATSLIAYFSMFAQLGIPTYGIRACARIRDDREKLTRTVHELLGINLVMNVLSYALLVLSVLFIHRLREEKTLYFVVSISILLNSLGMEWLYKALEQYTYITIRSILFKLIALAATFLLIHSESDYIIYGGITIFAASASNLLNLINASKYISLRRPGDCNWRRHMKSVAVFFALSCAATIYTNLDALMLGFMTSDADVGFYNAAVKVKTILVGIVTALGAVLLPRSSYYVEHGQTEQFRSMTRKAIRFVLLSASAVMCYFILFAKESIFFLSGEEYRNAIPAMQIIMPTVLFIGLTNILGIQILVPMGKEKVVLKSEIAGAAADLVLNALLIPTMKSAGAAVGTVVAEAVVLIVQYIELKDVVGDELRHYKWLRLTVALLLAAAASLWVKLLHLDSSLTIIFSAFLFFGVYMAFLFWKREETIMETKEQIKQKKCIRKHK